jgi:thiamine-phosphate pyrophosphorylase
MFLVDQLRLVALTDPGLLAGRDPVAVCRAAVRGGATMVQVRWKAGSPREVLALTRALVSALPVPVLVNDRVDIALAAGAAGAHLGQADLPLNEVRRWVPAGFVLGLSVGSPAEAERVRSWPADYWSVGPCYATKNKADAGAALGPSGFAALARLAPTGTPVVAIGGITARRAPALAAAGAAGLAVIGAVLSVSDPEDAARTLRSAFDAPAGSPPDALRR